MASDIRAGGAFVELLLRSKSFIKGLDAAGRKLQSFGKAAFKAGAAVTTAFVAAAAVFAKVGDSLNKMAIRTGFSAQALSELKFAAQQSGTSIESVEKAIKGMQRGIVDAERGLSTATDNFDDLGVSLADLQGLNPEQQFELLAGRIAEIEDPSRRAALSMKLFGKAGAELLPMLANGVEGMNELRKEARDLGITMDDETAAGAAALTDALGRIKEQLLFIVVGIGEAIGGPLTAFFNAITFIFKATIDWVKANAALIQVVAAVALGVTLVGAAFVIFGGSVVVLSAVMGGLVTLFGVFSAIVAALVSPIGLVVIAIAGAATWFATATETGQAMVDMLTGGFGELWDIAKETFSGIAALLAAGEIQAAGELLWAGLKLLWLKGTQGLRSTWLDFQEIFTGAWHKSIAFLATSMVKGWGVIRNVWDVGINAIATGFDIVMGGLQKAWNHTVAFFERTWQRLKSLFGAEGTGAEIDRINAELGEANKKIDARTQGKRDARQLASGQDILKRDEETKAVVDTIGEDLQRKLTRDSTEAERKQKELEQGLLDARKAWESARDKGKKAVVDAAEESAKSITKESVTAAADAAPAASADDLKNEVFTTFSLAALSAQGGQDPGDKTRKAIEDADKRQAKRDADQLAAIKEAGGVGP